MLLTDFDFGYAWVFPIERWPAASSEGCLNLSTIHLAIWRVHVNSRVRMRSSLITAELFSDVSNLSSFIVHFEEWGSIFPWWWWRIVWLALQVGNEWIKLNMPHSRLRTRKAKLARELARELRFLLITQDYSFTVLPWFYLLNLTKLYWNPTRASHFIHVPLWVGCREVFWFFFVAGSFLKKKRFAVCAFL